MWALVVYCHDQTAKQITTAAHSGRLPMTWALAAATGKYTVRTELRMVDMGADSADSNNDSNEGPGINGRGSELTVG